TASAPENFLPASLRANTPLTLATPAAEELRGSDVFITYASIDDQPILQGHQGWVSQFYRNLSVRMEQLSGERVKLWQHPNPPGAGSVDQQVLQLLPGVKTL